MTLTKSDKQRVVAAFQKVTKNLTDLMDILGDVVATESTHTKEQRPKKVKDPNAPKRNLSSYMLYYQDTRVDLAAKDPTLKATELAKLIGTKWNELSDKEKQPYVKKAAKEKARFDKETSAYEAKTNKRKAKVEIADEAPTKRKADKKKSKKSSEKKKTF